MVNQSENHNKQRNQFENWLPIIITVFLFILLILGTNKFSNFRKTNWDKDVRNELLELLINKKSNLERALYSRIYYTKGIAAYTSFHPNISELEFTQLANELINNDSVIGTMSLSKNGVIGAIYPKEGHEKAIGLNLLEHPERREIVEQTIRTGNTFVAGPVDLVEGGVAFISYTPIFNKTTPDHKFWGVTDIVIKKNKLIAEAGLKDQEGTFIFGLKGENGKGESGSCFWGIDIDNKENPVKISIDLPTGNWVLSAAPKKGWNNYFDQDKNLTFILKLSSFLISILVGLLFMAILRIKKNEKELTAIFNSLHNLIIEFDKKGRYLKIASSAPDLLYKPSEFLIGNYLNEIFDTEKAKLFQNAIDQCLQRSKIVEIEYPLTVNGNDRWFACRVSPKTTETVIFNIYDITDKKADEQQLIESRLHLDQLNSMKDKLFLIIAHDLKNPIGSIQQLSELLSSDFDEYNENEKLVYINSIFRTSTETYRLLENLLDWSKSQQHQISAKPALFDIKELCEQSLKPLALSAKQKHITIKFNVENGLLAYCDTKLTETILRNLISNAIKFTPNQGAIEFTAENITDETARQVKLTIKDTGKGISAETINAIFNKKENLTTHGTDNEKGSGLGLMLCIEFAELQNGKIEVKSETGKGSEFSLILPKSK